MSSDSKYLSKELNLYSADSLLKLQAKDVSGNFELAYKDLATESRQPIVVKELWIETDSSGTLYQPIVDALHNIRQSVSDETTAREYDSNELWTELEANYASLNAKVTNEAKARAAADTAIVNGIVFTNNRDTNLRIDAEIKRASEEETLIKGLITNETNARTAADQSLQWAVDGLSGSLTAETVNREAADNSLYSAIQAEQKAREDADAVIHAELLSLSVGAGSSAAEYKQLVSDEAKARASADADEKNRAMSAESFLSSSIDAERNQRWAKEAQTAQEFFDYKTARESWESKTTARVEFIASNADPAALDSLSEIVSHFSTNGQSYADRLTYLENVIESLVNKKKMN